jgi:hypothetical protein
MRFLTLQRLLRGWKKIDCTKDSILQSDFKEQDALLITLPIRSTAPQY